MTVLFASSPQQFFRTDLPETEGVVKPHRSTAVRLLEAAANMLGKTSKWWENVGKMLGKWENAHDSYRFSTSSL